MWIWRNITDRQHTQREKRTEQLRVQFNRVLSLSQATASHSRVECVLRNLAKDLCYSPPDVQSERIAHALRAIAKNGVPYYHPKMREIDVLDIQKYTAYFNQVHREDAGQEERQESSLMNELWNAYSRSMTFDIVY